MDPSWAPPFDVLVISMHPEASAAIRDVFPGVRVAAATDLRGADPRVLHEGGVITDEVFETITYGRKYHHEIPTCGGVGLWASVIEALGQSRRPLLLLKEDCIPSPELPSVVRRLLAAAEPTAAEPTAAVRAATEPAAAEPAVEPAAAEPAAEGSAFDLAVFGPILVDTLLPASAPAHSGFGWCDGFFWGLHAVLYSSVGRTRARSMLKGPVVLQLDAKLSRLAVYGPPGDRAARLRILLQRPEGRGLASQAAHMSAIQGGDCTLCDMRPQGDAPTRDEPAGGPRGVLAVIGGAALFVASIPIQLFTRR